MATASRTVTTPHVTGLLPAGACLAIATSPGELRVSQHVLRTAGCLVLASRGNCARECGPILPHSGRAHEGFRRTDAADPGFGGRADRLGPVPILCQRHRTFPDACTLTSGHRCRVPQAIS